MTTEPTKPTKLYDALPTVITEGVKMEGNVIECGEAEGLAPIYVASRASLPERGQMWRNFRGDGISISSSWIDEDGEGESQSLAELWTRIADEIHRSVALVLYAEQGDFPLKGALIEAGIALGQNKPIVVCLPDVELDATSMRPIGSWVTHPLVRRCDDIDEAVKIASSYTYLATRATVPATGAAEICAEMARENDEGAAAWGDDDEAGRQAGAVADALREAERRIRAAAYGPTSEKED